LRLISIRDLRSQTRRIGEWLFAAEEVVVTSNGKPIAILSPVTEDTVDVELRAQRQARAFRAFNRLQELSRQSGVDRVSEEDSEHEIAAARRAHTERE
jgi:antitoxin (DNA-binding transcriptional repressor) of toxin-antitoxin stability system